MFFVIADTLEEQLSDDFETQPIDTEENGQGSIHREDRDRENKAS